jgi:hypothetical protein
MQIFKIMNENNFDINLFYQHLLSNGINAYDIFIIGVVDEKNIFIKPYDYVASSIYCGDHTFQHFNIAINK